MLLLLPCFLLLASLHGAAEAMSCSSGDTEYMCTNLDTCWVDLGFGSKGDLQYLCEIQGYSYTESGGNDNSNARVKITTPIVNITIPLGASANFRCSAEEAVQIVIQKMSEGSVSHTTVDDAQPAMQTTIQEIEKAGYADEGWYSCTAYGNSNTMVSVEAYLEIRDVCANHDCVAPKTCEADPYTATYECVCPSDCEASFDPVCGTDCQSYFNECTMKKESCERGVSGVTVASRGLCSFSPSLPSFTQSPRGDKFDEGARFSLSASAVGTPDPELVWFANGKEVGRGNTFSGEMNSNYKGDWEVKAVSCMGSFTFTQRFSLGMEEREIDIVEPEEQCCKVYGDPHVLTFDGLAYDYMGIGTFVIAQDQNQGEWAVYGSFEKCGDKTKQLSCVMSITVFYKFDQIQLLRMWRINSQGKDASVAMGQTRNFGEIKVENRALKFIVTLGDSGVVVKWDGIITSEVCVSKCSGGTGGLCANANCDLTDEYDMRGFMNPYTRSWKAENSAEFGNSWAVGADNTLEPEDGSLAIEQSRPCSVVDSGVSAWVKQRCDQVVALDQFSLLGQTDIDVETALTNCYYDGCIGVAFGFDFGCDVAGAATCPNDYEDEILALMATGMSRAEAIARMRSKYGYDSACMMGMGFVRDLGMWNVQVSSSWRGGMNTYPCPSDEALAAIRMCPTL